MQKPTFEINCFLSDTWRRDHINTKQVHQPLDFVVWFLYVSFVTNTQTHTLIMTVYVNFREFLIERAS